MYAMPETDRADANEIFPFHVRTVLDFGTKEDYLCRNLELIIQWTYNIETKN